MKKALDWYRALTERDRKTVLYGGIAAVILLLVGGLWGLEAATGQAEERLATKQGDLAWMQAVTPRLQAMPAARPDEPLPVFVDRTARDAGIAEALAGSDPSGNGGLRVRFEGASFDAVVMWLARLQQERGLVVESASIDGTATEGVVNASLVIRGP
jgi:type II secretory pathway component PulM